MNEEKNFRMGVCFRTEVSRNEKRVFAEKSIKVTIGILTRALRSANGAVEKVGYRTYFPSGDRSRIRGSPSDGSAEFS